MQSETAQLPAVKSSGEQICSHFPSVIPEELSNKVRRLDGYAHGVFRNGKPSEQMRYLRRKFAKRLRLSWDHVDRVTRVWMQWTTAFDFRRERFGRSTCLVITPRRRPLVVTTAEVRRRLAGAIRNHVAKSGRCRVGRKFLEGFFRRYGLPAEQILAAWRSLYFVEGAVCQWKTGQGERYLYVQTTELAAESSRLRQYGGRARVSGFFGKNATDRNPLSRGSSPRQSTSGISPPTGGKDQKTGGCAPESQTRSSAATPHHGREGEESSRAAPDGTTDPGGTTPRATGDPPQLPQGAEPQQAYEHPRTRPETRVSRPARGRNPRVQRELHPGNFRWRPEFEPLHVCDRWISGAKLAGKANFLAFRCFPPMHAQAWRVKFGPMHAFNFANAAVRAGFVDAEICGAYRAGLEVAHEAAARDWHGDMAADGWREPSQAIAEAWRVLRRDERSDEQRWTALFRGDVAPQLRDSPAGSVTSTPSPKPAGGSAERWRELPGGERIRETDAREAAPTAKTGERGRDEDLRVRSFAALSGLPAEAIGFDARKKAQGEITPAVRRLAKEPATFESHLKARGMTLAALLQLPRAQQQAFVREAFAAQKNPPDRCQKD